jgi:hypothetical protein
MPLVADTLSLWLCHTNLQLVARFRVCCVVFIDLQAGRKIEEDSVCDAARLVISSEVFMVDPGPGLVLLQRMNTVGLTPDPAVYA